MQLDLPYSEQAERSTLGAMILSQAALLLAIASLNEEDFYVPKHQVIFKAIRLVHQHAIPVDVTTVTEELMNLNEIEYVGGVFYLTELCEGVLTSNIETYVDLLKEKANLRNLLVYLNTTLNNFQEKNIEDVAVFLNDFEKRILDITRNRRVGAFQSAKNYVDMIKQKFYEQSTQTRRLGGVSSGYADLDRITNGWQNGDLIVLGARPSIGKTSLALNLAFNAAKNENKPVAIFSLEMPGEHLVQRMISFVAHIELEKLRTLRFDQEDLVRFENGARKLEKVDIFIDDTPAARIIDIQAKARKLKSLHEDLCLVIIDYLTLITPGSGKRFENRQIEVAEISRNLKALARELNVPVIALSQLSRLVERREDKRPILSDLKESGAIEQDADIVLFLHREDVQDKEKEDKKKAIPIELHIAKHRNGALGVVELMFFKPYTEFNSSLHEDD